MIRNPAPYSLPIIPCPLPSEIVDGEHFITADLLHLTANGASSSRDLDVETSSRELVSRTPTGSSTSTSGGSGSAQPELGQGERGSRLESLPLPRKGTSFVPRVLKIKKGGGGGGGGGDKSATERSWGPSERFCSLGSS